MNPLQTPPLYMGIDLRGRNISMAEHDLNRPKIGAALKQMRRERMSKHVRRNDLSDPSPQRTVS
jgi:hypothetical protein